MATISKKFVDLNPKFEKHPISGDIPTIKNEDAIKQAVKNIVLTVRGEKLFRPFPPTCVHRRGGFATFR